MRPKKRVLVRTEHGELKFVLKNMLSVVVVDVEEPGTDPLPERRFELVLLDGRGGDSGEIDLVRELARLQAIAGKSVPVLLISSKPIVGIVVDQVVYRSEELQGGLMARVIEAVRIMSERKRGPAPADPADGVHVAMMLGDKALGEKVA